VAPDAQSRTRVRRPGGRGRRIAGFFINPALQTQPIRLAEGAPSPASVVNVAAFNLGNAGCTAAPDAVPRARLVRTLRELGVGLDDVKHVLTAEASLADVAAAHELAIDAQIQTLRLQRAVLRAVARSTDPEELQRMTDLTTLTADERRRIVDDYVDAVFGNHTGRSSASSTIGRRPRRRRATPSSRPGSGTPGRCERMHEVADDADRLLVPLGESFDRLPGRGRR